MSTRPCDIEQPARDRVGHLHNMSCPPVTRVTSETRAVYRAGAGNAPAPTVFFLPAALCACGALDVGSCGSLVRACGGRRSERLMRFLARAGFPHDRADTRIAHLRGMVIGRIHTPEPKAAPDWAALLGSPCASPCTDVVLTMGVLARQVAGMILCGRPPRYTWDNLAQVALVVDDPRFTTEEPS